MISMEEGIYNCKKIQVASGNHKQHRYIISLECEAGLLLTFKDVKLPSKPLLIFILCFLLIGVLN